MNVVGSRMKSLIGYNMHAVQIGNARIIRMNRHRVLKKLRWKRQYTVVDTVEETPAHAVRETSPTSRSLSHLHFNTRESKLQRRVNGETKRRNEY
jgi:hypothetical protein